MVNVPNLVDQLEAESFKERQAAETALRAHGMAHFNTEEEAFLHALFASEERSPELRMRLEKLVEEVAIHHYFDRTNRGYIGITLLKDTFKDGASNTVHAIRVTSIYTNTPGARAGLVVDDMILAVDRRRIEPWMANQDFIDYVQAKNPGDTILLHIPRDGKIVECQLKLGPRPKAAGTTRSYYYPRRDPKTWYQQWIKAQRAAWRKIHAPPSTGSTGSTGHPEE